MCNNCIATICPNITIAQCTFVFWVSKQNGCSVYYRKEVPVARCNTTLTIVAIHITNLIS